MRYKSVKMLKFFMLVMLGAFLGCSREHKSAGMVYIENKEGKFTLYRAGAPYHIKGASGFSELEVLKEAGGNTIRIWDTVGLSIILKQANENGIGVIVGLPIPESQYLSFYDDKAKIDSQYNSIKKIVNAHKKDPALLMWCVGNELVFPFRPKYSSFYKAFNDIVELIHQDDPDHPVTTTVLNFSKGDIFNIRMRTEIDLLSFNVFGAIKHFKKDLKDFSWFWDGPYLITEWGIDGPWDGTRYTAWSAYIEPTSTKKAAQYKERYDQYIPVNDPGYLGSFIFFWGQKQETTHTWFSLFDEHGKKTESVAAAASIWTGKKGKDTFPKISYMLLNKKGAYDNIILKPNQPANAELLIEPGSLSPENVEWEIYPEDWYKKGNVNNINRPAAVETKFSSTADLHVAFKTPAKEGPYRLFVTITNHEGNIATANTPFYIAGNNEKK